MIVLEQYNCFCCGRCLCELEVAVEEDEEDTETKLNFQLNVPEIQSKQISKKSPIDFNLFGGEKRKECRNRECRPITTSDDGSFCFVFDVDGGCFVRVSGAGRA